LPYKLFIIPSTGIEKDDNSWSCFTRIYTTLRKTKTLLVKFTVYFVTSTQSSEISNKKKSVIPIPREFPQTHYDAVLLSRITMKSQLHWICLLLISKDVTPWQNRAANGALLSHSTHTLPGILYFKNITQFHGMHINVISFTHTKKSNFLSANFHETCIFSTALHVDLSCQILWHKTTYVECMDRSSFTCLSLHWFSQGLDGTTWVFPTPNQTINMESTGRNSFTPLSEHGHYWANFNETHTCLTTFCTEFLYPILHISE
jgi:hypothetical protein